MSATPVDRATRSGIRAMYVAMLMFPALFAGLLLGDPVFTWLVRVLDGSYTTLIVLLVWAPVAMPWLCLAMSMRRADRPPLRAPWGWLMGVFGLLDAFELPMITGGKHESTVHDAASSTPVGQALTIGAMMPWGCLFGWIMIFCAVRWTWERAHGRKVKFFDQMRGMQPKAGRVLFTGVAVASLAGLPAALPILGTA